MGAWPTVQLVKAHFRAFKRKKLEEKVYPPLRCRRIIYTPEINKSA